MTILAYVILAFVVAVLIIIVALVRLGTDSVSKTVVSAIVALIIFVALFCGMRWYYSSTAGGLRAMKDQQGNLENGLERTVKVYNIDGKEIWNYTGKMDLAYDGDGSIYFDDAQTGKRTIIYNPTGITIVEEK